MTILSHLSVHFIYFSTKRKTRLFQFIDHITIPEMSMTMSLCNVKEDDNTLVTLSLSI